MAAEAGNYARGLTGAARKTSQGPATMSPVKKPWRGCSDGCMLPAGQAEQKSSRIEWGSDPHAPQINSGALLIGLQTIDVLITDPSISKFTAVLFVDHACFITALKALYLYSLLVSDACSRARAAEWPLASRWHRDTGAMQLVRLGHQMRRDFQNK